MPRTITKTDAGGLTLSAAAIAMNAGDIVDVGGGTLNSNNATALGTQATVNVAAGARFSLGANQSLGALGDYGTIVQNGAGVQLNGNALTIGSGNNLSSTFSGSIADGTGGAGSLIKLGTGILTLYGSNTYTGPTTINQGKLAVDGWLTNSAFNVNGGTLGGTGYLSSGTVNAGGTLAPGDPLGVLNVSGNLCWQPARRWTSIWTDFRPTTRFPCLLVP